MRTAVRGAVFFTNIVICVIVRVASKITFATRTRISGIRYITFCAMRTAVFDGIFFTLAIVIMISRLARSGFAYRIGTGDCYTAIE